MKKAIALLGLVLAVGSIAHSQEQGKISFLECKPNAVQKMRLFAGADQLAMLNAMAIQEQCEVVTDLSFENTRQGLREQDVQKDGLTSVDNLPYQYNRNYCDGEDKACMDKEGANRNGEANVTFLYFNPSQIQTITQIADAGVAKKVVKSSIYFVADENIKYSRTGNGYDGKMTFVVLNKAAILIK